MTTALTTPSRISKPPAKVVEFEFSYSRSTGMMRWRHGNLLCPLCRVDVTPLGGVEKQYLASGFSSVGVICSECKGRTTVAQQWLCRSIVGDVWCRRADGHTGRLLLVCQLSLDSGGNATVWAPEGALRTALGKEHIQLPTNARANEWADFPQGRYSHRWRLCLNRAMEAWRIRDDDVDSEKIWNTNGYRGILPIRWLDSGSHLHVPGAPWVDDNGVVQFDG